MEIETISASGEAVRLSVDYHYQPSEEGDWIACEREGEELVGLPKFIAAYRIVYRIEFPVGGILRVHHHALPRMHRQFSVPLTESFAREGLFRTNYTSPGNFERLCGHQDMMLHNALAIFQEGGPSWVCGPLSEERAKIGYEWEQLSPTVAEVAVEGRFPGIDGRPTASGRYRIEPMFTESGGRFGPEVFSGYHTTLRRETRGRMQVGPLARGELIWGSWNEGIFRNIDHEMLLREAKFLAQRFPEVKWMQIDDGYHAHAATGQDESCARFGTSDLGVHRSDESAWCRRRFPRGMQALVEDFRDLGLRSMIWFSPSCHVNSPLVAEHPEWFRDEKLHFVPEFALPDFSLPAVRDLVCRALDRMFVEWGFEGVKLDFWTYGFLSYDPKFRDGNQIAHEWLRWIGREIRDRVGEDGLMLSCLETANGDPLMADLWDMHRIGPDLSPHSFPLETLEEIAIWVAATHGLKQAQKHSWMADGDGFSLYRFGESDRGASAEECDARWRLVLSFLVASGSAVELAGRLSEQNFDPRFPAFHRAVQAIQLGQKLVCPGYDWVDNEGRAPRAWWTQPHDGRDLLGLTNWSKSESVLEVPPVLQGARGLDIFSGEPISLPSNFRLPAGDGRLFALERRLS